MAKRIAARWWLPLVSAFVVAFLGILVAVYANYNAEPMYIGRATVMANAASLRGIPDKESAQPGNITSVPNGQRVLASAAKGLSGVAPELTPKRISSISTIFRVRDTSIVAVEATAPNAIEARVVADTVGAAFAAGLSRSKAAADGAVGKIIDPAFVRPADRHTFQKLLFGLMGGFFAGTVLGLVLAASIPISNKESSFAK